MCLTCCSSVFVLLKIWQVLDSLPDHHNLHVVQTVISCDLMPSFCHWNPFLAPLIIVCAWVYSSVCNQPWHLFIIIHTQTKSIVAQQLSPLVSVKALTVESVLALIKYFTWGWWISSIHVKSNSLEHSDIQHWGLDLNCFHCTQK